MLQCIVKCNALTSSHVFINNTVQAAISGTKQLPDVKNVMPNVLLQYTQYAY
jgi:hypothetical protein